MTTHYDVVIIGSGAGGGTVARALASTGRRILVIERGGTFDRDAGNWDPAVVWMEQRYRTKERWLTPDGEFQPNMHYGVGGNTKFWVANQVQQPELLDKVNFDKMIEEYGDGVSAPPTVMRDAEEVAAIRQGRQRQLDQQVAAEQARAMAGTVKDLASSPTGGDTALSRVMDAMGREQ